MLALLVAVGAFLAVWVPWRIDRDTNYPVLREVRIEVPGLRQEVQVLEVADLGGDRFGPGQSQLASLLGNRRFEAIVFAGDMDGARTLDPVWEIAAIAKQHSDRVWYLPGNHDRPSVAVGLEERGIPRLPQDGAVALVDTDPEGRDVALVYGRSAKTIGAAKGDGRQLLVIASHTPPEELRLGAGKALGDGMHLYIAGHTHGGQMRLPLIGAYKAPFGWDYEERAPGRTGLELVTFPDLKGRFVDGLYERDGQHIFVSRGLEKNTVGRRRFWARAEMVVFRFVPVQ